MASQSSAGFPLLASPAPSARPTTGLPYVATGFVLGAVVALAGLATFPAAAGPGQALYTARALQQPPVAASSATRPAAAPRHSVSAPAGPARDTPAVAAPSVAEVPASGALAPAARALSPWVAAPVLLLVAAAGYVAGRARGAGAVAMASTTGSTTEADPEDPKETKKAGAAAEEKPDEFAYLKYNDPLAATSRFIGRRFGLAGGLAFVGLVAAVEGNEILQAVLSIFRVKEGSGEVCPPRPSRGARARARVRACDCGAVSSAASRDTGAVMC